jgi:hypothetical protein
MNAQINKPNGKVLARFMDYNSISRRDIVKWSTSTKHNEFSFLIRHTFWPYIVRFISWCPTETTKEPGTKARSRIWADIRLVVILVFYIFLTLASDCLDILPSNNACRKVHPVGAWALKFRGWCCWRLGSGFFLVYIRECADLEKLNVGEDLAVAAAQTW